MSDLASAIHPKRNFSQRAASTRAALRYLKGGPKPREAELTEICACLEQDIAMLDGFAAVPARAVAIAKLIEGQ